MIRILLLSFRLCACAGGLCGPAASDQLRRAAARPSRAGTAEAGRGGERAGAAAACPGS